MDKTLMIYFREDKQILTHMFTLIHWWTFKGLLFFLLLNFLLLGNYRFVDLHEAFKVI